MYCNGAAACSIGQTSTYSSSGGADTSKIAITVKDGGCFNLKTVSNSSSRTVIGNVGKDDGSLTEIELNVGDLTLAEADAKKAQFLMVCEDNTRGGALIGYADRGKATTTINIGNGGSLVMRTKGIIGQATTTTSTGSAGMSSQAEVHISMIGNASLSMEKVGTSDTASNLIIGQAKYGNHGEKIVSATVEITMSGTSKFTLNTGGCIGGVDSSADSVASAATAITMSENAQFVMSGGNIGYSGTKQNATEVTIELQDKACFQWTKGTIGGSSGTSSTSIVLRGESKLTRTATNALSGNVILYDGATYSTGSGHSSDQAITMHGGNLANATNYKGTSVVIDVDEAFSGAMKMGKLSADKVTSFKANGQEVWLEDLGSGTLRLSGGDRIKLGKESAWVKDSVQGDGQRHALFQFTSGSGSVGADTAGRKITLDFGGELGDGALKYAEDGEVEVEVWFTNGTLTLGGDGGEASDFFDIGDGWGLHDTSVELENETGKLLITGNIYNVWKSKEQLGDPGESGVRVGNLDAVGEEFTKVVIDDNTELKSTVGGGTLKQLGGDCKLHITGSGEVTLDNSGVDAFPNASSSTLTGALETEKEVNLHKTGDGTLTLGGGLTAGGDVTVAAGELVLGETCEHSIGGELSLGKSGTLQVDGSLTLSGTSELSEGKLSGDGTITVAEEGNLTVGNSEVLDKGLSLKVDGNLTLCGEQQRGTEEGEGAIIGSGTLIVDEEGQLSTGSHLNMEVSGIDVKGTLSQEGGQIAANDIVVEEGGKYELKTGTITSKGDGRLSLQVAGAFEMSGGEVTSGSITLSGSANLTQSNGTINGGSITLSGATMTQTGGEVTGGTLELNDGANLTQSDGTIKDSSISLKGGATMTQDGGQITGGSLDLSGGATLTQSNGTINGGSITLSGEDTGFTQEGGSIGKDATFSLNDGATLTLRGGGMNAAVTMEGEASLYDLGNQVAEGSSITMQGGSLANAGNYAGKLTIQTDATYTGALDLGGVDAARITKVQIEASGTELRNLKSGSTLTFRAGDEMVVGEQHVVYRGGQTESAGGTMVQFQDGKGQIAFGEAGKLQLRLENKILKDIEGQLEILFTNGSFSGMPEGGQKELEAWLKEHFVLETGLDGIKVLLLNDAEGGHLILTGSTEGVWIASRNGQNVDVADLLNNYSAVIVDEDLTLTLPTTQEETPTTIVHQLRSDKETHGDFIVKTESGATAGHTVQLHNENTDTDGANGDTNFYGNIRVEGTGLEAATLEKTGDAALNVHGNLESSGTVQVKEGTLALGGTANSIGTLAMSGGKLQVDGALELTGATEMSEESRGSISGEGNVKLGSGASLTLAGGVSYEVQNTQLENGAQMSQKGEAAIKGGSIKLSGEGTGYTQASGTISGATFTLTEGASFAQAGGSIDGGAAFSLSDGANLTQSNGTINGTSVTLSGEGTGYTQASGTISGATFTLMEGASFAQAGGSIDGGAAFSLSDGANLTQSKGAIDDASITLSGSASMRQDGGQITGGTLELSGGATMTQSNGTINGTSVALSGEGTSYTQAGGSIGEGAKFSLSDGAKLTLSGGSMNGAVTMEGRTSRYDLGNQAAQGSITMHGGSLANAGNYAGKLAIQTSDTYTGALDLGGVDAARITSIQLAGKDTYLTGLKEGSTLTLHTGDSFKATEQNVWVDGKGGPEGKQAFFQFGTAGAGEVGAGSVVDVESGAIITLDFVGKQIAEAVGEDGGITLNVWVTNGQLGGGKTGEAAVTWAKEHFVIGTGWGLDVESYDAAQGMLVLKGQSNIWDAAVDGTEDAVGHVSVDAKKLSQFDKVVIDERTTMTAEGPDGVVRQLEGSKDLEIQGSGTVAFENKHEESAFVPTGDTTLHGNVVAGDEVDLRKTGDASLTVEGDLKAGGDVAVEEGKLAIGGNDSFIDGELSLGKKGAGGEEGGTSGTLQVDGKLTLSGGVSEDSQGSITGSGTVVLDGDFTVGDVELGKDLTFQMGEKAASANFGDNAVTLQDLEGKKNVTAGGVTLTGEGTFSGAINGDTTMHGEYALSGANINGTLDNSEESVMILSDASEEALQVQKNLVLRKDATTRIFMDLSNGDLWQDGASDTMVNVSRNIIIEDGTIFEIHNLKDIIASNEDLKNVVIMRGAHVYAVHGRYEEGSELDEGTIGKQQMDENVEVKLTGTLNWRYKEAYVSFMNSEAAAAKAAEEKIALFRKAAPAAEALGSTVSLTLIDQDVNPVIAFAETFNEKAGAALLSGHVLRSSINGVDPDVERVAEVIAGAMQSNPSVAHKALAAMAGSTLTSVSAAQSAALRNQTSRVRDHALQAARLRCAGNDEATQQQRPCKTTHVWVEGTSFFSEQHSIGDESGYRLNSWGGAVGIDAQVNAHWSVGLSLAANYGDLEARAADYAKGDLDSYYVSAWSQAKNGRWGNTLLFTVGTNEADLRRTVNYGAGSYTATSNASGSSLGAMWELTCDFHPVKENKSNILQPLFNVAVQHTSMDGFSEKNAGGVGLATEKQTRDTMTLGLGLRWLAAIDSAKAVNRTVSTELHANVAQDLGDRRSVANVALLTDPNFTQSVYGSKTGSTAFQFGAGVNVPMTPNSCIYVNAGGELREHANTWNATLGVRMGF